MRILSNAKLTAKALVVLYFLGHSLVSWFSKKQNSVALSTAEAQYVMAGSCCARSLYIKQ
jgi:hypothetical protein